MYLRPVSAELLDGNKGINKQYRDSNAVRVSLRNSSPVRFLATRLHLSVHPFTDA